MSHVLIYSWNWCKPVHGVLAECCSEHCIGQEGKRCTRWHTSDSRVAITDKMSGHSKPNILVLVNDSGSENFSNLAKSWVTAQHVTNNFNLRWHSYSFFVNCHGLGLQLRLQCLKVCSIPPIHHNCWVSTWCMIMHMFSMDWWGVRVHVEIDDALPNPLDT